MVHELAGEEPVLVAYGDCLSDINIREMVENHRRQQSHATVAIAHPTGRNEILALNEQGEYIGTKQGKKQKHSWVNACSMVLEACAFDYLKENQEKHFASSLMDCLAAHEPVQTYRHEGFWSPVETIRDKTLMENLWAEHKAPWKVWED